MRHIQYLFPFEVNDFIESLKLLQIESVVLIFRELVEGLEDAHHLPLS